MYFIKINSAHYGPLESEFEAKKILQEKGWKPTSCEGSKAYYFVGEDHLELIANIVYVLKVKDISELPSK
ncbi:hypothetical protein H0W91_02330 [Patescibacteria group bacterium]|nr:hypothetical protein [Patescibacteria group bacterium]